MENDGNDGVPQGENSIREERHGNKHFLINCIQDPITKRVSLVENEIDVNQIPPYDDPSYYLCFRNKRHSSRPIYANQGTPFLSPYTQHQKGKITKSFFLIKCAFLAYMKLYKYQNSHKNLSEMQPQKRCLKIHRLALELLYRKHK